MTTTVLTAYPEEGIVQASWTGLAAGESGAIASIGKYPTKSVQISGTFGGGTVAIHGSNDGVNFAVLQDALGTDLTALAAAGIFSVDQNTRFIRPIITGGAGVDIDVTIIGV
jgi:hypothetical protein